jgi:hypothetical protein
MKEQLQRKYPDAESIDEQYELLSGRTYSVVKIKFPDRKKSEELLLLNSYCPHCGEKYKTEGARA